ncbi:MAG: hypothetical protein ACK5QC_01910 [Bacteroidota bacterium]
MKKIAIKSSLIYLLILSLNLSKAQSVNQVNGSFNYNKFLLPVPSNRGTGISLYANYSSGIMVNQAASEIGLGWGINAGGAIYRSVSGTPDDVKLYKIANMSNGSVDYVCGSLYPEGDQGATKSDVASIKRNLDLDDFIHPEYDRYSISGPEISGQLNLNYFKYYQMDNVPTNNVDKIKITSSSTRKPQFHFNGDFADTLISRHYPNTISNISQYIAPGNVNGNGYTNSSEPFIGKSMNGSNIVNQNFDMNSGRYASSNFVEYFTNAEIDNANSLGFNQASGLSKFVDFKANHARNSNSFPSEGIGYFRVTASNGLTYHYSLPVYELESTIYKLPLDNYYGLDSYFTTNIGGLFTTNDENSFSLQGSDYILIKSKTNNKFAVKWLLTAITGVDYVDSNNNHMVDLADAGYWISYNYHEYSSSFTKRYPAYGFDFSYSPDDKTSNYPLYFPLVSSNNNEKRKLSGLWGNVYISKSEIYHLTKIVTSSHTAFFIRGLRLDEKGSSDLVTIPSNYKPAPDLYLKRIVLVNNVNSYNFETASNASSFTDNTNYSQFDLSGVNYNNYPYKEAWFQHMIGQSASWWTSSILKNVEFTQDYSLCKNYHYNTNVNYPLSTVLTTPYAVNNNISVSNYENSGKLTLNKILTYEENNIKTAPSDLFDYDKNNQLSTYSNPNYNPLKTDNWGYYKNDVSPSALSRYTNSASKDHVMAWSLKKITDPLGGETEIEYESNTYNRVIDNETSSGVRGAAFIYRVRDVTGVGDWTTPLGTGPLKFSLDDISTSGYTNLTELSMLTNPSTSAIAYVCIPHSENICSNYSSSNSYLTRFTNCIATGLNLNYTTYNNSSIICANISPLEGFSTRFAHGNSNSRIYTSTNAYGYYTSNVCQSGSNPEFTYTGNGFLCFVTPVGYNVYGGGVRVKKLKVKNSPAEVYETLYEYTDGVAGNEADKYSFPRLRAIQIGSVKRFNYLMPKSYELFDLPATIVYSKVTTKNLGQVGIANGKIEKYFVTNPQFNNNTFNKNASITTFTSETYNPATEQLTKKVINECIDIFGSIFGSNYETRVFDKNENMINKVINEFAVTEQGSLTENFHYTDNLFNSKIENSTYQSAILHSANIYRMKPIILKSSTTYGMGSFEKTETLRRDEITGESVVIRSTSKNKSSAITYKIPAYKHYAPIENLDFTQPEFRTRITLGKSFYNYTAVDTTLTGTLSNGYSNSFLNANYNIYSKTIRQVYTNNNARSIQTYTLPYYFESRSFNFDAGVNSLNENGLVKKTELNQKALPISTISANQFWEPANTSDYNWRLNKEITLIDEYKNIVEVRDRNNGFSACKYGYNGYFKNSTITNCNYASYTFADFESNAVNGIYDGDIIAANTSLVSGGHTGVAALHVSSQPAVFSSAPASSPGGQLHIGLMPGRIYRASAWVNNTNLTNARININIVGMVGGTTPYAISNYLSANSSSNLITTIGNWSLLQIDFEIPENFYFTQQVGNFSISLASANGSGVVFDDFIFKPVESDFSAHIYNNNNGRVVATLDNSGFATTFVYDAAGKVLENWKEIPSVGFKKIKSYSYNFARSINN